MKTFLLICFLVSSLACPATAKTTITEDQGVTFITIDDDFSGKIPPTVIQINLSSIHLLVTVRADQINTEATCVSTFQDLNIFKRQKKSNIEEIQNSLNKSEIEQSQQTPPLPELPQLMTSPLLDDCTKHDKKPRPYPHTTFTSDQEQNMDIPPLHVLKISDKENTDILPVHGLTKTISNERKMDISTLTNYDDWRETELVSFTARNSERRRHRVLINEEPEQTSKEYWIQFKNVLYNSWTWRDAKVWTMRVFGATLLGVLLYFIGKFMIFVGKLMIIWKRGVDEGLKNRWERERVEEIRLRQERLARRPVPEKRPKNKQNRRRR